LTENDLRVDKRITELKNFTQKNLVLHYTKNVLRGLVDTNHTTFVLMHLILVSGALVIALFVLYYIYYFIKKWWFVFFKSK